MMRLLILFCAVVFCVSVFGGQAQAQQRPRAPSALENAINKQLGEQRKAPRKSAYQRKRRGAAKPAAQEEPQRTAGTQEEMSGKKNYRKSALYDYQKRWSPRGGARRSTGVNN